MAVAGSGEAFFPVLKNEIRAVRTALWFRPGAYCIAAALVALLVATVDGFLPKDTLTWLPDVERETVEELLKLLAGSMLTVATVTLSVLMLVLSLAAGQVSPRAVPEIMADPVTQNALGTFLATFVFSLAALLLFGFHMVTGPGVTMTFLCALLLAMNAVRYLVQWIHHVAEILKVNRIIHSIHRQARSVLETYLDAAPSAACEPATPGAASEMVIRPSGTGYVQLIDSETLHNLACEHDLFVRLCVQEGDFVHPHRRLMTVTGKVSDDEARASLQGTAVVGFERSHEGDPRLGFELLAEVACRALSPGINDPQSALACIEHLGSLLAIAGERPPGDYPPSQSPDGRVEFTRPGFAAMLERAFRPVMRDGASHAEVICAIAGVLKDLAESAAPCYLEDIMDEARRAEAFGMEKLLLDADRQALARLVAEARDISDRRSA
ncbi:DUF2254 domain-containing protein [Pelagibius sp. 7325]|uniref:DUF2254 domain-containing protein n=1 Tax=Pelagibius sp. 7325 TaxID=3131994 RepID=UPI0030EC40FA